MDVPFLFFLITSLVALAKIRMEYGKRQASAVKACRSTEVVMIDRKK